MVIETSMETGSVALVSPEKVLFERSFFAGRKPSAALWEPLEAAMKEVTELAAIVVGTGPGSYNGVRIAIAAAQGIALVKDCPAVGLSSFERVAPASDSALAIGDARRGHFSAQEVKDGRISGKVRLLDADDLEKAIASTLIAGREVFSFEELSRFPMTDELRERLIRRQAEASRLGRSY